MKVDEHFQLTAVKNHATAHQPSEYSWAQWRERNFTPRKPNGKRGVQVEVLLLALLATCWFKYQQYYHWSEGDGDAARHTEMGRGLIWIDVWIILDVFLRLIAVSCLDRFREWSQMESWGRSAKFGSAGYLQIGRPSHTN